MPPDGVTSPIVGAVSAGLAGAAGCCMPGAWDASSPPRPQDAVHIANPSAKTTAQ